MHLFPVLLSLLLACPLLCVGLMPTKLIYQAPNGTWLENLAVRSSGSVLMTSLTGPNVWFVDPHAPSPGSILVHSFTEAWVTGGITETTPDTFYVAVANFSITAMVPAAPGSIRLFRISFPDPKSPLNAQISLAATLPDALLVNAITTLNANTILAADTLKGVVWAVDVVSGSSFIAISDPLLTHPAGSPVPGLNGLKIFNGNTLYFTNSARFLFGKIPLHPNGTAAGPAVNVTSAFKKTSYDDFALDSQGDAFLPNGPSDSIAEVNSDGEQKVVAGERGSTEIAEPTAAQFGRTLLDNDILYVTTAGGLGSPINGTTIVGGQLVAVYTGVSAQKDRESWNGGTLEPSTQHPIGAAQGWWKGRWPCKIKGF